MKSWKLLFHCVLAIVQFKRTHYTRACTYWGIYALSIVYNVMENKIDKMKHYERAASNAFSTSMVTRPRGPQNACTFFFKFTTIRWKREWFSFPRVVPVRSHNDHWMNNIDKFDMIFSLPSTIISSKMTLGSWL